MYAVYGVNPIQNDRGMYVYEMILVQGKILFQTNIPMKFSETRIIIINKAEYPEPLKITERRYKKMVQIKETNIENIASEIEDDYSDDSLFNIASWGADLSFRELVSMYDDNELVKPELQRKYIWDKVEASRFIESILLGLPVPSIFLAQSGSQKLIVDGYQRIMTVYDYIHGYFSKDHKTFNLSNTDKINPRWRNKTFAQLSTDDQRKIKSTTIHAIIFEQRKPENDDTSLYQIFERINTSGRTLTPQEIRNCVYQGSFNTLLFELNKNEQWRALFGSKEEDDRMRDMEYILRFFAIKTTGVLYNSSKQISLKKELNNFMNRHKNDSSEEIEKSKEEFNHTIKLVYENIGETAFRNYNKNKFSKKFHPAIYDAIMTATFLVDKKGVAISQVTEETHRSILESAEFRDAVSKRTTDVANITRRIQLTASILFGVDVL